MLCPICKVNELLEEGANALSRKDNKTEICSSCGTEEAIEEFIKFNKKNHNWILLKIFKKFLKNMFTIGQNGV